jgi:YD repeat-containing protein
MLHLCSQPTKQQRPRPRHRHPQANHPHRLRPRRPRRRHLGSHLSGGLRLRRLWPHGRHGHHPRSRSRLRQHLGSSSQLFTVHCSLDVTRWQYHEPTGLLTNKLHADGNGTAYAYTPDGKLATRTWARGITTSYEYAPCCGNLTAILYSDGTPGVTNQYDRLGRQVAVIDGTGEHAYVYDPATLALAEEHFLDGTILSRAQDTFGRPAGIALGSGYAAVYGYDAYGRFGQVSNTQFQATYSYLPGSHLLAGYTLTDPVSNFQFQVSRSYEPHRDLISAVSNTFPLGSDHGNSFQDNYLGASEGVKRGLRRTFWA